RGIGMKDHEAVRRGVRAEYAGDAVDKEFLRARWGPEGVVIQQLGSIRRELELIHRTLAGCRSAMPSDGILRVERSVVTGFVEVSADRPGGVLHRSISEHAAVAAEATFEGGHRQSRRLDHFPRAQVD